jgi:hypothetical protein
MGLPQRPVFNDRTAPPHVIGDIREHPSVETVKMLPLNNEPLWLSTASASLSFCRPSPMVPVSTTTVFLYCTASLLMTPPLIRRPVRAPQANAVA